MGVFVYACMHEHPSWGKGQFQVFESSTFFNVFETDSLASLDRTKQALPPASELQEFVYFCSASSWDWRQVSLPRAFYIGSAFQTQVFIFV